MHHPSHRGIANFINPNSRWFVIGFTSVAAFIYAGSLGYFTGINISQQYMMGPSENGWHLPIATNWNWEYPIRRQTHFLRVYLGPEFVFFSKCLRVWCFLVKSLKELLHLFAVGTHLDMYDINIMYIYNIYTPGNKYKCQNDLRSMREVFVNVEKQECAYETKGY